MSMKKIGSVRFFKVALLFGLIACQHQHFSSPPIFEDESRFVRLIVDQAVGGGHSHPASITTEEMSAVLSGVIIEEPTNLIRSLPLPGKSDVPPRHPAFSVAEVAFLAPLLVKGLESAKPEEIVTFYRIVQQPGTVDYVTSGGVFIDGEELHFLLSNYRSPTRYPPDAETMTYVDGRSTPLQPIVPQETQLTFHPATALAPSEEGFLKNPFRSKRQEIAVLFKGLTKKPANTTHESH
ncbi:hypothetical protein [Nitrospira sp. BLG_2]|uniref:hypothetical protein n=1 Tax=Nitrospira sp. BLG_2 TaxID=3397507 RepID=UPI003B9CA405